jgi:hypothetical protein
MFPLLRNRAARALDVAIDFATLGEYSWEASPTRDAPARGANRRAVPAEPHQGAPARPAARLVAPASAAALRLRPAPAPVAPLPGPSRSRAKPPKPAPTGLAQLALDFEGTVATPPIRTRGGSTPPAPQPCETARR